MKIKIYILIIFLSITSFSQTIFRKVYTDKTIYTFGDTAHITIRAINTSLVQDTIIFPNSCEAYPFVDNNNYLMTFGILCAQILSPRIIPPSDSIEWIRQYPISTTLLSTGQHSVFGYFVELLWNPFRSVISTTDTIIFYVEAPNGIVKEQKNNLLFLEQNFPNPFNPITQITFALPKASKVELIVFDILGQEISTLINEERSTGIHRINFNASNLSSGVYFYQLRASDPSTGSGQSFVETKKMILLK